MSLDWTSPGALLAAGLVLCALAWLLTRGGRTLEVEARGLRLRSRPRRERPPRRRRKRARGS